MRGAVRGGGSRGVVRLRPVSYSTLDRRELVISGGGPEFVFPSGGGLCLESSG